MKVNKKDFKKILFKTAFCSMACDGKIDDVDTIDQSEQSFLDDDQLGAGFILTCIAYPKADCTVYVHQEDELY